MGRITWRTPGLLLGLVLAIHVASGLITGSAAIHTGGDNAAYVTLAHSLASQGSYTELWHPEAPPHTMYPPLYPGLLAVLMLLGAKTWGVFKALSLLLTTLATAFCFLWVRRLHDVRVASLVALLFGVAPAVLYYSQWILAEPLFMTVVFASLWLMTPAQRGGANRAAGDKPRGRAKAAARRRRARNRRGDATGLSGSLPAAELAAGLALVVAAYFTRSAGLPLVAAAAAWLALRRKWTMLGIFAVAFAALAVPWQLRSGGQYASAFWLVNPYDLDQGTIGLGGLLARVGENLRDYTVQHVPTGLTGLRGAPAAILGVALAGFALAGWLRRIRSGPGVAEVFFLLYAGLIMVWPVVWSGDRFALPLLPLILLYAGEELVRAAARLPRTAPRMAAVAASAVVLIPAGASWLDGAGNAGECRVRVVTGGPFACYGSSVRQMQAMALWTREWLPPGSVVFARKPRLFHAFSGHPSAVYPFTSNTGDLLALADSLGVDHLVLGNWDASGRRYALPAVSANPDRFCLVTELRDGSGSPISLLAITAPPTEDPAGAAGGGEGVRTCPNEGSEANLPMASLATMTVPILERE